MSPLSIIVISPPTSVEGESELINKLFDLGIKRYHINKLNATEQLIAELLEKVNPNYLNNISLHSHFHLVLAYGVGGIHYSKDHRLLLKNNYQEKLKLYQGFGIMVSTEKDDAELVDANYYLDYTNDCDREQVDTYSQIENFNGIESGQYFTTLTGNPDDGSLNHLLKVLSATSTD